MSPDAPKLHGNFLSVIVYDGALKSHTASGIIQGYAAGLWRGFIFPGGDGISRARNNSTAAFLETSCEYHDLIDHDIIFGPEQVKALRRHGPRDIVVGIYAKKTNHVACVYNSLPEGNPPPDERGLMEIAYGGTGFMRIHRRVYEAMIAAHPELRYTCDLDGTTKYDLWGMGVADCPVRKERRYLTEDWMFCHRARALGLRVWADTTIDLGHIGTAVYPLAPEIQRVELARENERLKKENAELVSASDWHQSAAIGANT